LNDCVLFLLSCDKINILCRPQIPVGLESKSTGEGVVHPVAFEKIDQCQNHILEVQLNPIILT
jgi:hypothetical protein